MAGLTWILTFLCVTGCCQSSASPVLRSARVVQVGQNVTLTCNLTSSAQITWYLLRSDQLLPLLTVKPGKLGTDTVDFQSANSSHFNTLGDVERGAVSLEIMEVEEDDAGLYFCTGLCAGLGCVGRGSLLAVNGADGKSARDKMRQPCWGLGICIFTPLFVLISVFSFGLYLCSGKPAVCCCNSGRGESSLRITEDSSLQYSSLRHADKPRPPGQRGLGLVKEDVTYSTVATRKIPDRSRDHR
ncbi:uncharacterized protein LOC121191600 [Toxotes jaculatrix]|uniref:uncharacterized protein LOC121191600 n=1 Tax=Toxotes jaculatrix TaxID=941984 RepID=UPI001B3AFE55|nr:uncharacterized protein LOC121191600 [Toxotes jaculatrix]